MNRIMRNVCFFWAISMVFMYSPEVFSVPAAPIIGELRQPDGSVIKSITKGDEWLNWTETTVGFTIAKGSDGYWYYVKGYQGLNPVLTPVPANQPPPPSVENGIKPVLSAPIQNTQPALLSGNPPENVPTGNFSGKVLFILTSFSNQSGSTTEAQWADFVTNKLGAFYNAASYGKVNLSPAAETSGTANNGVVGWVNMGYNHPNTGQSTGTANQQLAKNAILAADPYVNFAAFDTNHDGYVDSTELAVVVIVAGYEMSYGGSSAYTPNVWGHQWCIWAVTPPVVDGVTVGDCNNSGGYAQFGEIHQSSSTNGHMATLGIMAHELGHLIFGFPDLYDTDYSSSGIGAFCLMSGGSWGQASSDSWQGQTPVLPSAWIRYKWGWVSGLEGNGTVSVTAAGTTSSGNTSVYRTSSSSPNEYFLVENRQPIGYDRGLEEQLGTGFGGVVIFHIDDSMTSNTNDAHRWVDLEEADGTLMGTGRGSKTDLWYLGNATTFNDASNPNSKLYSGASSGVNINQISASAQTMSVAFGAGSQSYALTLSKTGTGTGTVSGGGSYVAGATVNLTATPDAGSTFAGWSPSPCAASFTMPASNLTCTATFTLTQTNLPDLIVTAVTSPTTGVAGGSIDISVTLKNQGAQAAGAFGVVFYLSTDSTITTSDIDTGWGCPFDSLAAGASTGCGGPITLPANVAAGTYYFGAYADNANAVAESNETNNGLAATHTITIASSGTTYTLTLAKAGTGTGTVSGGGSYAAGATVNLTATPASGSTFAGWSPSPCAASFAMPANNLTCTATFNQSGQAASAAVGVFRAGTWYLDANGNGLWDGCQQDGGLDLCLFNSFGQAGDLAAAGDWNGDGKAKVGVFRNGTWYLDYNGNGAWDGCGVDRCYVGSFGQAGDLPAAGDWNGDGKAKVGVFRNGTWYLDYNGNGLWDGCQQDGGLDLCLFNSFGQAGDLPAAGDWNGDGKAKVGVFRNGTWYLDYNGNGLWDGCSVDRCYVGSFGQAGDLPAAGDWNGDGKAKVGVFRNGTWYLDYNGNGLWDGCSVDRCYVGSFGIQGDLPVAGHW